MQLTEGNAGREEAFAELVEATLACGYPTELAEALAMQLRTEMTMRRMASYLRMAQPKSVEEIADEALAILSQRDSWVEKHKRDYANERLNEFYNRPRDED